MRYQRQIILPNVGQYGQEKLSESRVLIVGAGGLGNPVGTYLAAAGVGTIGILDFDTVSATNFNRQFLFTPSDINQSKVHILAKKLSLQNPLIEINPIHETLDFQNCATIFADYDIIIDGTDNFETKFLINDFCAVTDKPFIFGGLSQMDGTFGVFQASKGSCYRCLYSEIPKAKIQNCADAGMLGPLAGIIGSFQAMECLKLILSKQSETGTYQYEFGNLVTVDTMDLYLQVAKINRSESCQCHRTGFQPQANSYSMISKNCTVEKYDQIIDVRSSEEWNKFHLLESLNLPIDQIEGLNKIPAILSENMTYGLICDSGARARKAQWLLGELGLNNLYVIHRSVYEYSS